MARFLIFLLFLFPCVPAARAVEIETLDSAGNVGAYTSITLDDSGNPFISYYDITNQHLKFIYYNGTSWENPVTVDTGTKAGAFSCIKLDSNGAPHICYYDAVGHPPEGIDVGGGGDLKHAYFESGSWKNEVMDLYFNSGAWLDMELDGNNKPVCLYQSLSSTNTVVIASSIIKPFHIINMDCVAYCYFNVNVSTAGYRSYTVVTAASEYASWRGIGGIDISRYNAIETNSAKDKIHSVYYSFDERTNKSWLWYREFDCQVSTNVEVTPVLIDSNESMECYVSAALDNNDILHVSFYDYSNRSLKYAYKSGAAFQPNTVDSGGVGTYNAIDVDGAGNVYIIYYDYVNGALKYAFYDGIEWGMTTVDTGNVGKYNSLAVDAGGNAHISYYAEAGGNLKYAKIDSASIYAVPAIGAYPNPYRPGTAGHTKVTFTKLPAGNASVKVFTLSGEFVTELSDYDGDRVVVWEDETLDRIKTGLYYVVAENNSNERARGKLAIIKQ